MPALLGYLLRSSLAALLLRAFVCGFNLNRGFCLFCCRGSSLDLLCSRSLLLAQLWRIVGMEYSRRCFFSFGWVFLRLCPSLSDPEYLGLSDYTTVVVH